MDNIAYHKKLVKQSTAHAIAIPTTYQVLLAYLPFSEYENCDICSLPLLWICDMIGNILKLATTSGKWGINNVY